MALFKKKPQETKPVPQALQPTTVANQTSTPRTGTSVPPSRTEQGASSSRASDGKAMTSRGAGGEQQRSPPNTTRAPSAELRQTKPHEVALIDGIDSNVYNDLVKEIGQPARRRKKVNTTLAEKMQRAGWSYAQIAKHFRVSACTIRRRLHEAKR